MTRVEQSGEPRHEAGHDGSENEMPCGQEEGCSMLVVSDGLSRREYWN